MDRRSNRSGKRGGKMSCAPPRYAEGFRSRQFDADILLVATAQVAPERVVLLPVAVV
jgi:hypothetical protein